MPPSEAKQNWVLLMYLILRFTQKLDQTLDNRFIAVIVDHFTGLNWFSPNQSSTSVGQLSSVTYKQMKDYKDEK